MVARNTYVLRLVSAAFLLPFHSFAATVPGTLPGDFAVGEQGEGAYSIPIATPAGSGGLKPSLALSYNHLSGNDLAGMHWVLTGISAITRCPKTYAQDGVSVAVNNTSSDRFCLDGQRLVEFSGAYGAANTEYRTEIESFRRVVQIGTQAGGPQSFRVDYPNGQSGYYGVTEDSRVGVAGSVVRRWFLSYLEDQFGNRINYTYTENTTTGETLPFEITWTQNVALATPPYKVAVVYEQRPTDDQRFPFDASGAPWQKTQRIDKITVTYNGQLINTYDLTYGTSPAAGTGRSQLASVQICGPTDCLPPTTFTVQNGTRGWGGLTNSTRTSGTNPLIGDYNGDGKQDVISVLSGTWRVYYGNNTASGFDSPIDSGVAAVSPETARVIDYSADGNSDLLFQSGGTWHVLTSIDYTPPFSNVNTGLSTSTYPSFEVRDFDGDGLEDLIFQTGFGINWMRNTGGALAAAQANGSGLHTYGNAAHVASPDVNGDGRSDLFVLDGSCGIGAEGWEVCTGDQTIYIASGSGYLAGGPFGSGTFSNPRAIDVNGDGLDDLLYVSGTTWRLRLSLGGVLITGEINTGIPSTNANKVIIADYDNDGRQDLIRPEGDYWLVHRGTGTLTATYSEAVFSPGAGSSGGFGADINGDGFTDIVRASGGTWQFHKHNSALPDVVTRFTDGLGYGVTAEYSSLSNTANYTADFGGGFGPYVHNYSGPRYVVTTEVRDSGLTAPGDIQIEQFVHKYRGGKVDVSGRGWVSFAGHNVEQPAGTIVRVDFFQGFPLAGRVSHRYVRRPDGPGFFIDMAHVQNEYGVTTTTTTVPNRHFVRVERTTYTDRDPSNNALLTETIDDPTYDPTYGSVTQLDRTATQNNPSQTWRSSTTTAPVNFVTTTEWCLGLPSTVTITNTLPDFTTATRRTVNTYNASTCVLDSTTDESEPNLAKRLKTVYTHNAYGNVTVIANDSADGTAQDRSTTIAYDAGQQLPASTTINGVGLTTQFTWNYLFGQQASIQTPDLLTTRFYYDDFGRLAQEIRPQSSTTMSHGDCPCWPQYARFYARAQGSDGSVDTQFFDERQRVVGKSVTLPLGTEGRTELRYNYLGQLAQATRPYVSVDPVYWVTYSYEPVVGRLLQEDAPVSEGLTSGATTTYLYPGRDTWVTDANNHTTKYVRNSLGQVSQITDALNGTTTYSYAHFGELRNMTDAEGKATTVALDARGLKTSLGDPNMGTWAYDYDAYGQLKSQTNALGQAVNLSYDAGGRLTQRVEPEGTSTYTYYTTGAGAIGKPNTSTAYTAQSVLYQYSSTNGSPTLVRTTIAGTAYDFNMSFDSQGRLDVLTYPASTALGRFKVDYDYDSWGNLVVAKDGTTPTRVFYSLQEADARGRDVNVLLGNGLTEYRDFDRASGHLNAIQTGPGTSTTIQNLAFTWDETGNLLSRTSGTRQESFTYDELNRLRTAAVTGQTSVSVNLSAAGRITTKSDAGGTYTYGSASHPYAVTNANGQSYTYDANGQMTNHGSDTFTWYSFGLPEKLSVGANFTKFFYDAHGQRYSQTSTVGSTTIATIRQVGSLFDTGPLFESEVPGPTIGGGTTFRHYVEVRGHRVALVKRNGSTETLQYLHRDHQESVVEVTGSTGTLVQSLAYDAWGLRRDPSNWAALANPFAGTQPTKRGYTDHEHLDAVELIHMNGRVQDPKLGRFISSDPSGRAPLRPQSLNAYSYAANNPSTDVDPTGYCIPGECPPPPSGGAPIYCDMVCPIQLFWPLPDPNVAAWAWSWEWDRSVGGGSSGPVAPDPGPPPPPLNLGPSQPGPAQPTPALPDVAVPQLAPPLWARTSGICLGGCHGTMPEGEIRPMNAQERLVLDVLVTATTLPLGGEFFAGIRAGSVAMAGSRALVPAVDAVYATASERIVAGYTVWGNAGRVGATYNVNVLLLNATEGSQGLGALAGALRAEAAAAGASRISIQGLAIVNEGLAGMSARAAARYGLELERVNAETIILTGGL